MSSIVHLHGHSHYSILDGLGKIDEICGRAKEIGASAISITDHASVSNAVEFNKVAKEYGIKPLFGVEFYVVDNLEPTKGEKRYHLVVLAKSYKGLQSIYSKLTKANQNFYKRPRIAIDDIFDFEDCVISTACSSGLLSRDDYYKLIKKLHKKYKDDLYLEIMPFSLFTSELNDKRNDGDDKDLQRIVNERAIALSNEFGIDLIATNDYHYVNKADSETHDLLLTIQSNKTVDDPNRWRFNSDQMYIKDLREMAESFMDLGYISKDTVISAIENTVKVADKCNVEFPDYKVHLPTPFDSDDNEVFNELIVEGWHKKLSGLTDEQKNLYRNRLIYEIKVIKNLDVLRYFLVVADIVKWAKNQDIEVGTARGSGAGSLVCYLLDITDVDPIRHNLFFERFMNPERIDLPDIDIDFQDNRRGEVFEYIRSVYGYNKTANINTLTYMSPKNTFRDVCRAFGIEFFRVNMLSKQIEDIDSFDDVPDLVAFAKANPKIIEQTKKLIGTIRQVGVHAAGIVVSNEPINNVGYYERRGGQNSGTYVINWDKDIAESVGLLKIDILGLTTLTTLNKTKKLVRERHKEDIDLSKIDLNDPNPYKLSRHGATIGVFQFEGNSMRSLLKSLEADNFNLITDATALIRPGSLQSGQTNFYVQVQKGDEYPQYTTDKLKPILQKTNSVMVYQEQIMKIFVELGDFTWAEADKMRKIIGKKLGKDEFDKYKDAFVDGCERNGIDNAISEKIFENMAEFASYSFNRSHAVGYSVLSYYCMFFKYYFPLEYMCALLTTSIGNTDNIEKFTKEAEKMGVKIGFPDINKSSRDFVIDYDTNTLIPPFGIIKGFGGKVVDAILDERDSNGKFISFMDFKNRINKRVVHKNRQKALIDVRAFAEFGVFSTEGDNEKLYAELLPCYNKLPQIQLKKNTVYSKLLKYALNPVVDYYKDSGRMFLHPYIAKNAGSLMFINNAQKSELENLTGDGTKYLLKTLKELGIPQNTVYYTSYLKHNFGRGEEVPKDYTATCKEVVKSEIQAVNPELVICFVSDLIADLHQKEKMGNMIGRVIYNKELDTYVLFSWSPQFAYFKGDDIQESYLKCMETIKTMLS